MKKRKLLSIVSIFICICFTLTGCTSSHGIPNGVYHPGGEHEGLEYAWQIKDNEAEYLYVIYQIMEEDGKIYFAPPKESKLSKYEVEYHSDTGILELRDTENAEQSLNYKK